jgi:hypothetical protein
LKRTAVLFSLVCAARASLGCAPAFDPPSEVKTLRILGVQKDKPYAKPDDEVTLRMLWHDGSPEAGRSIKRVWLVDAFSSPTETPLATCVNPPGDLYYACINGLSSGGDGASIDLPSEPVELPLPEGDEITVRLEGDQEDILQPRGVNKPSYGLAYIFFAICAGERFLFDPSLLPGLPLSCVDASGAPVGPDGFVAGYSAIYYFANVANNNPMLTGTGFTFRGEPVVPDCLGAEQCVGLPIPPEVDCSQPGAICVPACPEDGELECPEYRVEALVSRDSAEVDEVSRELYQSDYQEQLWTNYYVDRGSVGPEVKLVNDAVTGWNDEQFVEFRAPKDPGKVTIWAVVHDNRGGSNFVRFTFGVQ